MEATIVLVGVLMFLFGGMMLALVMGYRSIEEDRAQQDLARRVEAAHAAERLADVGFFARIGDHKPAMPTVAFDDVLLAQLEKHVRAEHAMVAQFVHFPSVDSLYSKSGSPLHVH